MDVQRYGNQSMMCLRLSDYEGAVYGGLHLVVPAVDRLRFEVGYSPDRGEPKYFFGMIEKVSTSRWRSR